MWHPNPNHFIFVTNEKCEKIMKSPESMLAKLGAVILLSCVFSALVSAHPRPGKSIFDHLEEQGEILKVDLKLNVDSIMASKSLDGKEVDGIFSYKDAEGNRRTWKVDLEVRGKFRRRICTFPPLKIQFKKKELKAEGFNDHNDLKLVTHCMDSSQGNENVLREFLVYKMYEVLSREHYRAKLLRIRYINEGRGQNMLYYGFLLEDEDEMKERYDCELCEDCYGVPRDSFHLASVHVHDLFQYMIGNPDWSTPVLRNLKLLRPVNGDKCFLVPYDFDFSGAVNTSYAIPDPILGISDNRQRKFMGMATSKAELEPAIQHFRDKRAEVLQCIDDFKPLNRAARKDMLAFIESFYECLDDFEIDNVSLCGLPQQNAGE